MRKWFKVEYHGRIKYNFQRSCDTGPWCHICQKRRTKKSCLLYLYVTDSGFGGPKAGSRKEMSCLIVDSDKQKEQTRVIVIINPIFHCAGKNNNSARQIPTEAGRGPSML
jgi:hypothetical protein